MKDGASQGQTRLICAEFDPQQKDEDDADRSADSAAVVRSVSGELAREATPPSSSLLRSSLEFSDTHSL